MIDILGNTLTFILALGIIIFVHELGHLLIAKFFDVRVKTFSLGFGKRLWGFKRGETDYRVALIPLGGYVQMAGEDGTDASDDPREFVNKPRWQRILVYIGGPAMNVVLSVLLIAVVFTMGIPVAAPPNGAPFIGVIEQGSAAERGGLRVGDLILSIDGAETERWDDVNFGFLTAPGRAVDVEIEREGERLTLSVTPDKVPNYEYGEVGVYPRSLPQVGQVLEGKPAEAAGLLSGDVIRRVDTQMLSNTDELIAYIVANPGASLELEVLRGEEIVFLSVVPEDDGGEGRIGVTLGQQMHLEKYPPLEALAQSVRFNINLVERTFEVLGKLFTGQMGAKSAFSGPIEIASMSGQAARTGAETFIYLIGVISISIGILNLLPIPVLDGGQIVILLIESLRRRDLSLRLKERIQQVGFLMIVALMVMVLYFDLVKNIPAGLLPGS